ncbi:MAG: hypothetical protein ACREC5_03595 [Thermoplasmata archaeon]
MSLVGQCQKCGAPAHLRCSVCGRTLCSKCLDSDERICAECASVARSRKGLPSVKHPPSRLG